MAEKCISTIKESVILDETAVKCNRNCDVLYGTIDTNDMRRRILSRKRRDIIQSLGQKTHHQKFNDTDIAKRVKRELRNQSPYFEQVLYVTSVLEEQPIGTSLTTVREGDRKDSSVVYSMVSLLDSRSQSMFKARGKPPK